MLKDSSIMPNADLIQLALGESYPAFDEIMQTITQTPYNLTPKWNYYNDGKAWLCKVEYKKKTVFWLSVWNGYFKTGFYFTEKNCQGIANLDIPDSIKEDFNHCKPIGKLMPLAITINNREQISTLLKVIEYKKGLK